jgi:hypothetical protein
MNASLCRKRFWRKKQQPNFFLSKMSSSTAHPAGNGSADAADEDARVNDEYKIWKVRPTRERERRNNIPHTPCKEREKAKIYFFACL